MEQVKGLSFLNLRRTGMMRNEMSGRGNQIGKEPVSAKCNKQLRTCGNKEKEEEVVKSHELSLTDPRY